MNQPELDFWSIPTDKLLAQLKTKIEGLANEDVSSSRAAKNKV